MKEKEQSKEEGAAEYVVNTCTLDRYFNSNKRIKQL
jgi:hypothetical protein